MKALPLPNCSTLYRGSGISNDELNKILCFKRNNDNMPGGIVFSKSFLSFNPERMLAEKFLSKSKNVSPVLFILEKDNSINYNLSTHCDLEKISFYPAEKEVLFFPFSTFEIRDIKQYEKNNENRYEIRLFYLGRYLKDLDNEKNNIINDNKIPESEFKKQLFDIGLIKKEKLENNSVNSIKRSYKEHNDEYISNKNIIRGEIIIGPDDINKDIPIINSFENFKKKHGIEDKEYSNEKDIKENVEIKINGEKIPFSYFHKFKKEGKYKIEYLFIKDLTKINHLFYGCWKLTNLDLSNFSTEKVVNMSYMFYDCFSLTNLNLSNFNTQNAENISNMFNGCKSLTDINLSNSNIQNVKDKNSIFYDCNSLKKKIISLKNLKFE